MHTCYTKNLIVVTIPKSGTHLLSRALQHLTHWEALWGKHVDTVSPLELDSIKADQFYILHAQCTSYNYDLIKHREFKVILLVRDPRDVLLSWAHWLKESPDNKKFYEHISLHSLIAALIENYRLSHLTSQTIVEFFEQYLCWLSYPKAHIARFENLVGPLGGGSAENQKTELQQIAAFLELDVTTASIVQCCTTLFGRTTTFREGQIGAWKKELTPSEKKALQAVPGFNKLLMRLQYEKNENW